VTTLMLSILAVWFVAIFLGPPLWLAMALAGWAFLAFAGISDLALAQRIAKTADSFPLLAAPLFILMGNIMNSAGVTKRIFDFATVCVGWMRGGLCHANIVASVFFAGTSGSAVADAGGLGTLEIKAMTDEGYSPDIAAALTASSATIGPIIPPSLPMIIYGVSAETSIGGLFLAGVIPGLLMTALFMLYIGVHATIVPGVAPKEAGARTMREFIGALADIGLAADQFGRIRPLRGNTPRRSANRAMLFGDVARREHGKAPCLGRQGQRALAQVRRICGQWGRAGDHRRQHSTGRVEHGHVQRPQPAGQGTRRADQVVIVAAQNLCATCCPDRRDAVRSHGKVDAAWRE